MHDEAPVTFDVQMRAEIRRRLKSYQARHGNLGAPTLHSRIRRANPRGFDFSLKTMQRLLGDSHDTFDAVYNECLLFLSGAEEPDALAGLGNLMAGLFGYSPSNDDNAAKAPEAPPPELEGQYHVYAEGPVLGGNDPEGYDPRMPYFPIPYSRIVFTAVPHMPWFRAIEYVGNPRRVHNYEPERVFGLAAEICTGTLTTLATASSYLVALRGFTFNHPKFYLLTDGNLYRTSPPTLDGNGIDREPTGQGESVFAHLRVLLRPVAVSAGSEVNGVTNS